MFVIAQRIKSHIETAHSIIRQLEQLPDVNCYICSNYRCPVISIQFAKWTCPIISTLQILISGLQPVDHVQSSIGSARSYQVVKEIQATLSMYCNRQQKHISTSSNSQIISLVYRMVVMYYRKIGYVAYVSRLQSNHLNQGKQMRFCEKICQHYPNFS